MYFFEAEQLNMWDTLDPLSAQMPLLTLQIQRCKRHNRCNRG